MMRGHLKDRHASAVHLSFPLIFLLPLDLSEQFSNSLKSVLWLFDPQLLGSLGASSRIQFGSNLIRIFTLSPLFLSPPSLLTSPLPRLGSGISGWYIYSGLVPRRCCLLVHNSISSPICFQIPGLQNTSQSLKRCCAITFFKGPDPLGRILSQPVWSDDSDM